MRKWFGRRFIWREEGFEDRLRGRAADADDAAGCMPGGRGKGSDRVVGMEGTGTAVAGWAFQPVRKEMVVARSINIRKACGGLGNASYSKPPVRTSRLENLLQARASVVISVLRDGLATLLALLCDPSNGRQVCCRAGRAQSRGTGTTVFVA